MTRRKKGKKFDAYLISSRHIRARTKRGALRQAKQRVRVRKS